jgi:hypothetical protein
VNYYFKTNRGSISIDISSDELLKIEDPEKVIYTCNTNNYSPVSHFRQSSMYCKKNNYSYYVFTDRIIEDLDISNQIIFSYKAPDPRYAAKVFKILPFLFFDTAQFSLWVDANIFLLKDLHLLMNDFVLLDDDFLLFEHNKRNSIIEESIECVKYGKDNSKIINSQISQYNEKYKNLGNLGLYQGRVLLRKHTKSVKKMSDSWWGEISNGSIRDQLSLPVTLTRVDIKLSRKKQIDFIKYFEVMNHNKYKMYGIGNSIGSNLISLKSKLVYYLNRYLK